MVGGVHRSVGVITVKQCSFQAPECIAWAIFAIHSYSLTNDCSVDQINEHESCCMLIIPLISV
eukprot:COSAG02_NODE_473_length_21601_cov_136.065994_7_plen_63_part_00